MTAIWTIVRHNFAAAGECGCPIRLSLDQGGTMASWGSFAWGFFSGLLVGQVILVFALALVRQNNDDEVTGYSPPIAADHETFAPNSDLPARLA